MFFLTIYYADFFFFICLPIFKNFSSSILTPTPSLYYFLTLFYIHLLMFHMNCYSFVHYFFSNNFFCFFKLFVGIVLLIIFYAASKISWNFLPMCIWCVLQRPILRELFWGGHRTNTNHTQMPYYIPTFDIEDVKDMWFRSKLQKPRFSTNSVCGNAIPALIDLNYDLTWSMTEDCS